MVAPTLPRPASKVYIPPAVRPFASLSMSLLNEAYRLRYTGESAGAAKKRKALAHLDETIERAEHAHQAKRAKAEAEFREKPRWFGRHPINLNPGDIERWKEAREGTTDGRVYSVHARERWLRDRGLAPLSEEETPSLDTVVRRHVDATVGKEEAVVPLTTALLRTIRDACASTL